MPGYELLEPLEAVVYGGLVQSCYAEQEKQNQSLAAPLTNESLIDGSLSKEIALHGLLFGLFLCLGKHTRFCSDK